MVGALTPGLDWLFSFISRLLKANLLGACVSTSITHVHSFREEGLCQWGEGAGAELVKEAPSTIFGSASILTANKLNRLMFAFTPLPLVYFHHGFNNFYETCCNVTTFGDLAPEKTSPHCSPDPTALQTCFDILELYKLLPLGPGC